MYQAENAVAKLISLCRHNLLISRKDFNFWHISHRPTAPYKLHTSKSKCIYLFEKIVCFLSPRAKPPPVISSYSLVVVLMIYGQKGNLSISHLMIKSELVHNFFYRKPACLLVRHETLNKNILF